MSRSKAKPVRWSEEEMESLRFNVGDAKTAAEGFRQHADYWDRGVATVRQKWYSMQKASKAVKPKRVAAAPAVWDKPDAVKREAAQVPFAYPTDAPEPLLPASDNRFTLVSIELAVLHLEQSVRSFGEGNVFRGSAELQKAIHRLIDADDRLASDE